MLPAGRAAVVTVDGVAVQAGLAEGVAAAGGDGIREQVIADGAAQVPLYGQAQARGLRGTGRGRVRDGAMPRIYVWLLL